MNAFRIQWRRAQLAATIVIYYVVPNDNYTHVTYMDPRTGRTEAEFLRGMAYVLVDAVAEGVTFAGLVAYMRRVVRVDPMHVGYFVLERNRRFYFWIHLAGCFTFMLAFMRHWGCDTTFEFAWLRPGFDPANATDAAAVLWT